MLRAIGKNNAAGRAPLLLKIAVAGVLAFLYVPFLIILLYAFSTEDATFTFPPPGLTLAWFGVAWARDDIWQALGLSLRVAVVSTAIALVFGTLAAMAVTMPGSAIGSSSRNEIASRPKNALRYTASEASVPSTSAMPVDTAATRSESPIACHTSSRAQATPNQLSVRPGGGKVKVESSVLNAYRMMIRNGRYRNASTPATARRSGQRVRGAVAWEFTCIS